MFSEGGGFRAKGSGALAAAGPSLGAQQRHRRVDSKDLPQFSEGKFGALGFRF